MNISVKRLVIKNPRSIKRYLPEQYSPDNYHSMLHPGVNLWVDVVGDIEETLDYGKLVDEHPTYRKSTWKDFATNLTEQMLNAYKVENVFYSTGRMVLSKPVNYVYCNTKDYTIDYARAVNESTGIYADRFMCHDLKVGLPTTIDKTKILMFVNGYACYTLPAKVESAAYAYYGADFVTGSSYTPDVAYLDFSHIGGVVCHSLGYSSKTARVIADNTKGEQHQNITNYSVITISLDSKYDLNKYTAIVVINHHLVLPDIYKVTGKNTISLDMRKLSLDKSSLNVKRLFSKTIDENERCCMSDTYTDLQDQLVRSNSASTFIVLIKGKLCVDRVSATRDYDSSSTNEEGILVDNTAGSILGEVVVRYADAVHHTLNAKQDEYLDKDEVVSYIPREKEMIKKRDFLSYSALDLVKIGGL